MACACIGPIGNCPCIRNSKGLPIRNTEVFISSDLFSLLSEEDQNTINELKFKALAAHLGNHVPHDGTRLK